MNLNKAIIIGNVVRDPEVRQIPSGQSVASFSIATNRMWTDKTGQKQQKAEFHNIVAWGKLAEICQKYLNKGKLVMVEGRIETRSWEGQDGVRRQKTEIVAENLSALGPAKGGAPEEKLETATEAKAAPATESAIEEIFKEEKPAKKTSKKTEKDKKEGEEKEEIDLDEIPF